MISVQPIALAQPATVHLRLVQPVDPAAPSEARTMAGEELPWLGERVSAERMPDGTPDLAATGRRFQVDLGMAAGGNRDRAVFRKAAYVDLGTVQVTRNGWHVQIGWQAATLAPLFPVFAGTLTRTADSLVLDGEYAPPGGDLGVAVDRALLNIAARRTAVWLLRRIADALPEPRQPAN